MIPILYEKTGNITGWGLGLLKGCKSAVVSETLNGDFTAKIEIPSSAGVANELAVDRIVAMDIPERFYDVNFSEGGTQYFQIVKISKSLSGMLTLDLEHISHRLKRIVMTRRVASGAYTGDGSKIYQYPHVGDMMVWTFNLTALVGGSTTASLDAKLPYLKEPMPLKDYLAGAEGSITDINHCDWIFSNSKVRAFTRRGQDTGYVLRRGAGLKDLQIEESVAGIYTQMFPYWLKEVNGVVTYVAPTSPVSCQYASNYDVQRIMPMNCTNEFETKPTVAQLQTWATDYMNRNGYGLPTVSVKVDVRSSAGSTDANEYFVDADGHKLTHDLYLGDSVAVQVKIGNLYVAVKPRIQRYEYDVLTEKYTVLELGTIKPTLPKTLFAVLKKTGVKI